MPYIAQYLLKLSISLAVVYLFYALVLRRLTFYTLNRWYLLGYSLISFFIPFVDINPLLERGAWNENMVVQLIPIVGNYKSKHGDSAIPNIWILLSGILVIGMLIMLTRLLMQYFSLRKIRKRSELISDEQVKIYQVNKMIIPFSFGRSIFINQHQHNEQELQEIIRHEFIHVKQRHTTDILLSELLCLLNWYNPFAWLIRHSIRQNLEFIADHHVLQGGLDRKQYQYLLLKVIGVPAFAITSQFNFSSLKKRIAMMNKMRSAKVHLVKFLFVLPLVTVSLLAFRNAAIKQDILEMTTHATLAATSIETPVQAPAYPASAKLMQVMQTDTVPVKLQLRRADSAQVLIIQPSVAKDDSTRIIIDATRNGPGSPIRIKGTPLPTEVLFIVDGEEQQEDVLKTLNPDDIQSISVLKDASSVALYGERGRNGVILVTTKPGHGKEQPAPEFTKRPGQLKLITREGSPTTPPPADPKGVIYGQIQRRSDMPKITINGNVLKGGPSGFAGLIIVDGKPYDSTGFRELDLNPDRIQSINVMKGTDVETIYGSRAKNGVIFITLKKDDKITIAPAKEEKTQSDDRTSAIKSLVEDAQKKNILFVGLENQLPVQVKGVPEDQLVVSMDQGQVSMKGNVVSMKPLSPGTVRLTISRQKSFNSKPVVLETKTYSVKFLPAPGALDAFRAAYL